MSAKSLIHRFILSLILCVGVGLMTSCANRGSGPQGGPVDSIPPRIVASVPEDGTTNFTGQEIQLRFNEYVRLDKPTEQVLISPPQQAQPIIKAVGKKVSVTFSDTLLPNTTYTIYFGDAIQDNNEKNALSGHTLSFSTGAQIDSLTLSGDVIFAETLLPAVGAIVGIHDATAEDSVIYKKPFVHITRTDSLGHFTISHVASGQYRVYALSDSNRTYTYEVGEPVAFADSVIVVPDSGLHLRLFNEPKPMDTLHIKTDTLSVPTDTIDSVTIKQVAKDSTGTATLRVRVEPAIAMAYIQLLTDKEVVVATLPVIESVLFDRLKGGSYKVRMYIDLNSDSVWTTGNLLLRRQPEPMYYYPKRLRIRDNWDYEETFRWQDESVRPQ
ncbi:MAG: Ig-like domain-containing protein [Paludibacteraceae bacterium]|nr:Ig-like domain-containing protein [Paludibacteraceae bacterium]